MFSDAQRGLQSPHSGARRRDSADRAPRAAGRQRHGALQAVRFDVGSKASELKALREGVRKMLKENGTPPANGKWTDIAVLEPVRGYKARHASTLLTFDAVVDAIDQIEAKRGIR